MQIVNKIDHLITKLNELKPALSDDLSSNEKRFNDLLTASIANNYAVTDEAINAKLSQDAKTENGIPSWVDPDYGYDPQNPRKPNMRELVEAMHGKDIEELCTDPENLKEINRQAGEILYTVLGPNTDTRDWQYIMSSKNILKTAQDQTGTMYEPKVAVISSFDKNDVLTEQVAVIQDQQGNTLRSLSNDLSLTNEKLHNYGVKGDSIPKNLTDLVDPDIFNRDLLTFLKSFNNKHASLDEVVMHSTSDALAKKVSKEIPLDELDKL